MKIAAVILGFAGAALGFTSFAWAWYRGNTDLLTGGSAVGVGGMTLVGVAAGLATWQDERAKSREEQRRQIYGELVQVLFGHFTLSLDRDREQKLRANTVTWAAPEVVIAMQNWHNVRDSHVPKDAVGVTTLSDEGKQETAEALAALVVAVRKDLGAGDVTADQVAGALFNYHQPPA